LLLVGRGKQHANVKGAAKDSSGPSLLPLLRHVALSTVIIAFLSSGFLTPGCSP